ncbi:similar to Saccharomyces cerevisiae YLR413W Putative protein of unknown function [Maudiozyma barnettii]|uniref:Uncharacterized protein n=1 Tax=Maudiozyma barnettii TaxID=61262 RepID=A0A8H2VIT6_9SACH|nr:Ina1p [Kazachstania barnettii]CAB4256183.1 similar to Saccharomyces cerevisiae YLR413W Putative protein of unknown function [Kazachstania barnettii]CAD1784791.1 similar to Saccharomyces cerevisiae YLR413W Putative protein of unknown function [Kazachstania barnettii]
MQTSKLFMGCSFLFTFACFLFIIISMAGSSSNYKPLTNIYIGQADISHINVTKVIPQVSSLASLLGGILITYPNQTETIFATMKNISHSDALLPFLTMIGESTNTTITLQAVQKLAPLALLSGSGSSSTDALNSINELLKESKNTNQTVSGLAALVSSQSASTNTSTTQALLQSMVFQVLETSKNASATTEALLDITSINISDLLTLTPALRLVQYSNNLTETFGAVSSLMNVTIPETMATELFSVLNTTLAKATNITESLASLSALVPKSMSSSLTALDSLFTSSSNVTKTLSLLETIVTKNLTSSTVAKQVVNDIQIILQEAEDPTLLTTVIKTVMSSMSTVSLGASSLTMLTSATDELKQLQTVLSASNNSTDTITIIDAMEKTLSNSTDMTQYIPYLFEYMEASTNPAASFEALVNITALGTSEPALLTPLLGVLTLAASSISPTDKQMFDTLPQILEYLNIPVKLRLAIFTLCKANLKGEVLTCSKSHAVQNFDFRAIIFEVLMDSDFAPYLSALNIQADDLHLGGKLMGRQGQYVPTVKAALSMDILSFVSGFFLMIAIAYIYVTQCLTTHWRWFSFTFITMAYCAFTGLGTTVVTAIINIIKSGTAQDKYNVIVKANGPNMGMTWCGFALSVLMMFMAMYGWYDFYKKDRVTKKDEEMNLGSTSSSEAESQIIKENLVQGTIEEVKK